VKNEKLKAEEETEKGNGYHDKTIVEV